MSHDASHEHPSARHEAAEPEGLPPLAFRPTGGTPGPTDEHWLRYLVYIRGAVAALRFEDGDLTDRMRRGFDSGEQALDTVRAWAETERQLAAAIEILRAAQTRCTLAESRVGKRTARRVATEPPKAQYPTA
jgi:hypothetical protein